MVSCSLRVNLKRSQQHSITVVRAIVYGTEGKLTELGTFPTTYGSKSASICPLLNPEKHVTEMDWMRDLDNLVAEESR